MTNTIPFKAVIFDLDGVITQTALVHSVAWKEMFDNYLKERAEKYNEEFKEFTHGNDYLKFVDGKPRYEGVKSFLESRGIKLEYGSPEDGIEKETYCGIGNRKNIEFNNILKRDGVKVYDSTVDLIKTLKENGIKVGVASSSKNCKSVLEAADLLKYMETRVDGVVSAEIGLKGKPEADIFTTAADNLGVSYDEAVVVEDAISGVQAGKKGNFGLVLGIAREDNEAELKNNGADIVVKDISEIGFNGIFKWFEEDLEKDNMTLSYHDYEPEKERSREALLSVGNGFFGTRGALEETDINKINYPGTYMSGVYNRLKSKVGDREIENEDFVNIPNWLPVKFKINNDLIDINKVEILKIDRNLDFKTGLLTKELIIKDQKDRITKIISKRFASMAQANIAAIDYTIIPHNYSDKIIVSSALTANHINDGVSRYSELNQQHLEYKNAWTDKNIMYLSALTTQSKIELQQTASISVKLNNKITNPDFTGSCENGTVKLHFSQNLNENDELNIQKIVFIAKDSPENIGKTELLKNISFNEYYSNSKTEWGKIWNKIDIELKGDRIAQKMLRLHLYHLISTTSPNNKNLDFGIPARGLTGEAYRGHIFWDELYILPLYFIHFPEVAKSVLMYRYRRLDEAREYAKEYGYKGAMFPWQSGSSGREETQKYHYNPVSGKWGDDYSSLQRHISLAVAYNTIQYHKITDDKEFMIKYGAELVLEICRFWESKTNFNESTKRYSIDKVMGPDEFHENLPGSEEGGLKDNAYTNIMTAWLFEEIADFINELSVEERINVFRKINFKESELKKWAEISKNLRLVINEDGIISQFDGYFDLKEVDWKYFENKYDDIHRMDRILKAEGKSPDNYKVAKQADTLMLFYNLNAERVQSIIEKFDYKLPENFIKNNLEYYIKRTSHGSTLSRVVHAFLANQINLPELSLGLYNEALTSDYNDIQGGTTAEGIHNGVMAGTVIIALTSYAGINLNKNIISVNPKLPKHWKEIKFNIDFRRVNFKFIINQNEIKITANKNTIACIMKNQIELFENKEFIFKY